MKECIICNNLMGIDCFYKHSGMSDGHLNKCKECCKKQQRLRYSKLSLNEEFIHKERERGRSKYHRYKYKYKPRTTNYKYRNIRRYKFNDLPKHLELHHWSYKDEHIEDVIILNIKRHRKLHKRLIYVEPLMCFKTTEGQILDSREKHFEFIKRLFLPF